MYISHFILFICLFFLSEGQLCAKIRFLTFHYNRPDFIELQHESFKKFIQNDYELIVFNDGPTPYHDEQINETCEKLGIPCIRFEQEWHLTDPLNKKILGYLRNQNCESHISLSRDTKLIGQQVSVRHSHVIQYALKHYGYDHDDIVVIIDGDFFPIRPVDLYSLMEDNKILGAYKYIAEQDVGYFWVLFVAMKMSELPNPKELKFHVDLIGNWIFDTGAQSYHYLHKYPEVPVKKYAWRGSSSYYDTSIEEMENQGFNANEIELCKNLPSHVCVELHIDHLFLHFGASAFLLDGQDIKAEHVAEYIHKICAE